MNVKRRGHTVRMDAPDSMRSRPDNALVQEPERKPMKIDPLPVLDLMIEMGWGDTPQLQLPGDWRTRRNPKGKSGWA